MRIGIIAEGTTDQAVITNILKGLGIDGSNVIPIRPDLDRDETDRNADNSQTIGTWQGVKNACLDKTDFEVFFTIEDNRYIIVQLDTAEANHAGFDVVKPDKTDADYAAVLRERMIEKIHEWLEDETYTDKLLHAVAIEEIEAWVLTIYSNRETISSADPKTALFREVQRKNITKKGSRNVADFYKTLSNDFRKRKKLHLLKTYNQSLSDFIDEVIAKLG